MWNMKNFDSEAEKMAYQLKALAALVKDSSLILSTRVLMADNCQATPEPGYVVPFSLLYGHPHKCTHINTEIK